MERGHFTIREALVKSCEGNPKKWPDYVSHAFFTDRVTVRRQTGFSAYYLLYGQDPLLPFDLAEASFMSDAYHSGMTTTELLAARLRQIQKKPEDIEQAAATLRNNRIKSKEQFERKFHNRLRKEIYPPGTLVLVRNSAIERELDRKSKPRYLGPYEVDIVRREGRSYKLKELDGTRWEQSVAAFRIIPYISRHDPRIRHIANEPDDEDDPADPTTSEPDSKNSEQLDETEKDSDSE